MPDLAVIWDEANARGDWGIANGDLATDSPIRSAVLVSLFTDARASTDYVPLDGDPRGWWGDTYAGDLLGSRLWQFARAKKAGNTNPPLGIRDACRDALQWLLDDGVAAAVNVDAAWVDAITVRVTVQVIRPRDGTPGFEFSFAWDGL